MRDYLALQPEAVDFTARRIEWSKVHNRLMRSKTHEYELFEQEAELWKRAKTKMDILSSQRPKNAFVEPEKKR